MRRPVFAGGAGRAAAVAVGLAGAIALAALGGVGEAPGALTDWQALVLGLVQGLTELLPISSSGHLILVPWLGDWTYLEEHDEFNQTFDVALHLGTLVAVVAYFRHELVELVGAWLRSVRRRRIETPTSASPGSSWWPRCRRRSSAPWRGRDRRPPRRAVADRDPAGRLRRPALDRRPDARAADDAGLGLGRVLGSASRSRSR